SGNLYGTASTGGAFGFGAIYQLPVGTSDILTLYSFTGGEDGSTPVGGLIVDANGNLFGTTQFGGSTGDGVIFELPNGATSAMVLAAFNYASTGSAPTASLIMDANGNLFGTTQNGGANGDGTIFELASLAGGTYSSSISVLASFNNPVTGANPVGG